MNQGIFSHLGSTWTVARFSSYEAADSYLVFRPRVQALCRLPDYAALFMPTLSGDAQAAHDVGIIRVPPERRATDRLAYIVRVGPPPRA
jgi:hypothetical protein